ncbi:helix-turn-helix transcriptional regulator [Vibrio sp. Y2-5]|uniref:helix-turn-helix transcriptional regulator n=1 Tax=Vibrio sp. Y2-5 TaxID=2743977 RepID=UPI001660E688|nr:helix-turn-helix transcriptional regulator [Vibrio sp. Y2-5]MBD0785818.1 helix-turn-helix transcriptional regulator [Vibrio sp. Y2-5]
MTNIKQVLRTLGKSQDELAKQVGVSQSSINHYVKGNRKPSYEMAWKIVKELNCFGASCSFDDVFPDPQPKLIPAKDKL